MRVIYTILFLSIYSICFSQNFELKDSIIINNQTVKTVDTDLNNSIYLISDSKIEKRFATDKQNRIVDLKNILLTVDTSNPLRLYAYTNFNRLNILDENLSPIQDPIKFNTSDYLPIALRVVDNQFCWFYDMIENKLVQYNYQMQKPILTSKQIYLKNDDQSIEKIHSYRNLIYLKSQNTIYVYDDYANFKYAVELNTNNNPYYFYKDSIFYIDNNRLINKNITTKVSTSYLDVKNTKSIAFNESNFYHFNGSVLNIYSIKYP
ncbi:hypothetical protein [Chishuiella sp.]|uniref:hypothetical protein n=1 Tax=Chishuiella sp. TaxID=1969467 RepID=UPI0028A9EDB0|nr:hypothetical protein [Chishuiella sp.]